MSANSKTIQLRGSGGGIAGLFAGAFYPLKALSYFLMKPQLRKFVLVPILVNVVIGITVYASLLFAGLEAIDWIIYNLPNWIPSLPSPTFSLPDWVPTLPQWLSLPQIQWTLPTWFPHVADWRFPQWHSPQWLHAPNWLSQWQWTVPSWFPDPSTWNVPNWLTNPSWVSTGAAIVIIWLLRIVLVTLLLIVTGVIFLQFGVLLGAPWYGKLSEELERLQTGQVVTVEVGVARDITRAVLYELKKILLIIGIGIPLFLIKLIPGIGLLIATIAWITLTTTIVCMDFLDAAVERRRPRFREKLRLVWGCIPASAGFGLVCLGLISIPLINLISIPVCVGAGTLFFCDRVLPTSNNKSG